MAMEMGSATSASTARRSANYKPNIWNYDYLQSLTTKYHEELEEHEREAATLKEQVRDEFCALKDPLDELEFIDLINKLALSHHFEQEINNSLKEIIASCYSIQPHLYSAALHFRILRQHGYFVPQDGLLQLLDEEEEEKISRSAEWDEKARVQIIEASHLVVEDECLFDRATAFANNNFIFSSTDDVRKKNKYSVKWPLHRSVRWFGVGMHMHQNDDDHKSAVIHRLAGLSFNTIQVQHQKDLKDILRWWRNLGLLEVVSSFSRDRVVESFLWAVGVAYEPQYGSLRKWLTKAILLVLIIDDVYDIYGSIPELQQFTTAVQRWDSSEVQHLPEAIKKCFLMLYDTANEIDHEIQKQKGWNSVLPHFKKVWTGFCKSLLVEAKWYKMGECPSLTEYLENGWTSSSGPLLSLHILLGVGLDPAETMAAFYANQEIIRQASLIIRLCNDQGTFKAEVERGDAPSSIVCHMREANVGEREAREHIRNLILEAWKKMNGLFMSCPYPQQRMMRYVVNTARVANFIYQNGDGFGVQDRETKDQVLSCLIEPLHIAPLSSD